MKKILKPLILSAITLFAISCSSSDDNNSNSNVDNENEKALVVLDKIEVTGYFISPVGEEINEPQLDEQSTYKFEYDNTGKVSSILYVGKSQIYYQPETFSNRIDYTYNNGLIKEITTIDTNKNSTISQEVYEYNDKKQVIRITDKFDEVDINYSYNDSKIISYNVKRDYFGAKFNYKVDLTYDKNNNPKVITSENTYSTTPYILNFAFDEKANPFSNMNINFDVLFPNSQRKDLPKSFKFNNNLILSETNPKNKLDYSIVYEHNSDNGLPSKATSHLIAKKEYITNIITYTYKTIKVKK
ncbi:MAG: hypothetical protein ACRCVU_07390 [Flavobacterium sp.]